MMRMRTWMSVGACVLSLLAGCDSATPPSHVPVISPVYGDPCRYSECSTHGQCAAADAGGPFCLCDVGYAGARCEVCEPGFHLDALNRCAPDRSCAAQASNPCGTHGGCDDRTGVIACECDLGYEGPRCTLCASGYERSPHGECLALFL